MPRIPEIVEGIVRVLSQRDGAWNGTSEELLQAVRLAQPSANLSLGEVDEAVRDLHRLGRVRLEAPHGYQGPIRLTPDLGGGVNRNQHISVSGGNVQIGDYNQQAITYGNVLQTLVELIQEDSSLPQAEKTELTSALQKVLAHPLTQTIIASAAALGAARLGGK